MRRGSRSKQWQTACLRFLRRICSQWQTEKHSRPGKRRCCHYSIAICAINNVNVLYVFLDFWNQNPQRLLISKYRSRAMHKNKQTSWSVCVWVRNCQIRFSSDVNLVRQTRLKAAAQFEYDCSAPRAPWHLTEEPEQNRTLQTNTSQVRFSFLN